MRRGARINNLPNGGSSILSQLVSPGCYGEPFSYCNTVHVEEWVKRGARFVPRSRREITEARRGIRDLSEDGAKRFMKTMARATTPDVLFDMFNTPIIRKTLGCTPGALRARVAKLQKKWGEKARLS